MQGLLASAYVVLILPLVTLGSVKRTKYNDEIYLYLYFYFDHDNHELYMYMYMTECDKCVVWHDIWYVFFANINTRNPHHARLTASPTEDLFLNKSKVSTINSSTPMLGYYGTIYDKIYDIILYDVMWWDVMWCDVTWHGTAR